MLRNFVYGSLALVGGAITGIVISSWATPPGPLLQVAPEPVQVVSVAQPATTFSSTSSVASDGDCGPWEVSDVAMEAALNEMIRRGWRPPTQAEALDASFGPATPLDPDAPVPVRRPAAVSPDGSDAAEATAQFPVDQVLPTPEGVAPATPVISPTPQAPETIEEPTPPSN